MVAHAFFLNATKQPLVLGPSIMHVGVTMLQPHKQVQYQKATRGKPPHTHTHTCVEKLFEFWIWSVSNVPINNRGEIPEKSEVSAAKKFEMDISSVLKWIENRLAGSQLSRLL